MSKILIFPILLFLQGTSCNESVHRDKSDLDSISVRTDDPPSNYYAAFSVDSTFLAKGDSLLMFYENIGTSNEACVGFFETFPSNPGEFIGVYHYVPASPDSFVVGYLEQYYDEHVGALLDLNCVSTTELAEKHIALSVGLEWDADAVGLLHGGIVSHALENLDDYIGIISQKDDIYAEGFWYFILDNAHLDQDFKFKIDLLLDKCCPRQKLLMEKAFERLEDKNKGH